MLQLSIGFVSILLVFSILLLPTFIFLRFQKSDLARQLEIEKQGQENARVQEFEEKIKKENDLIVIYQTAGGKIKKITPLVSDIYIVAGKNIKIKNFNYSVSSGEVTVNGNTGIIGDFLDFESKFKTLPYFSDVYSPPSNVVKLKDVSFVLNAKLK